MTHIAIGNRIGRLVRPNWTPLNLVAVVVSDTEIDLTWSGGKLAKVERSTDNITYTQIGTGTDSYSDTGLTANTLYYYRVKGSVYSNIVSETTFVAQTRILIAAMDSAPDVSVKGLINRTYANIINKGLWDYLKNNYFYFFDLHTRISSKLNWANPLQYNALEIAGMTWAAKQGFTPNGVAGSGNDSQYKLGTNGDASLNDNQLGINVVTDSVVAGLMDGGSASDAAYEAFVIRGNSSLDKVGIYSQSLTGRVRDCLSSIGLHVIRRNNANYSEYLKDGVKLALDAPNTDASIEVTGYNDAFGGLNYKGTTTAVSTRKLNFAFRSKAMTDAQNLSLYNIQKYFHDHISDVLTDNFESGGSDYALGQSNLKSAVYFNGKTYVVYQGDNDDPYIRTFTHATRTWSEAVKIGTNPLANADKHGEPAIMVDDDGYIHCMFGSHHSAQKYSKSTNAEDITAWTAKTDLAETGCFPQLHQLTDGTIFVFYQDTGKWGYKKSSDGGDTWSAHVPIINNAYNYYCNTKKVNNKIHIVTFYTEVTEGNDYSRNNIYYLNMDSSEVFKNIDGDVITLPLAVAGSAPYYLTDTSLLVYHSADKWTPSAIVNVDGSGNPYILFQEGICTPPATLGNFVYKIAKYTTQWDIISIGASSNDWINFVSAIDIIDANNIDVYLIVSTSGVGGNIEKWSSINAGLTWSKKQTMLTGTFWCPALVEDYTYDEKILCFELKGDGLWNNKGYLLSEYNFAKGFSTP